MCFSPFLCINSAFLPTFPLYWIVLTLGYTILIRNFHDSTIFLNLVMSILTCLWYLRKAYFNKSNAKRKIKIKKWFYFLCGEFMIFFFK